MQSWIAVGLLCGVGVVGCSKGGPTTGTAAVPPPAMMGAVLATVNHVPITQSDLKAELKGATHQSGMAGDGPEKRALEAVIQQELAFQKGMALGLDRDPAYQQQVAQLEAQVHAAKRKQMAELFYRHEVETKATPSDAEVQAYFDQNAAALKVELHVFQILLKDVARVQQAQKDIQAGATFEDVARTLFPAMPGGQKPWDLGFLKWQQLPKEWRPVVARLKDGETSPVILGAKDRAWLIQVVERRTNPDASLEQLRPLILQDLKATKLEALNGRAMAELKDAATIVYLDPPARMANPHAQEEEP